MLEKFLLFGIKKFTILNVLAVQAVKGLILGVVVFLVALIFFSKDVSITSGIIVMAVITVGGLCILD